MQRLLGDLNALQVAHPALHAADDDPAGFAWLSVDDAEHSVFAFERRVPGHDGAVVVVANLQAVARAAYRVGLDRPGRWQALLTTDDARYAGDGAPLAPFEAEPIPWQGRSHSSVVCLPPLSVVYLTAG